MNVTLKILFALASVIIGIGISTTALAGEIADTIYHNGTILTINDVQPRVEAVAVKDGKILAVGAKKDILKSKGDATKLIDLGGHTMLPGFVDAHGHVMGGGLQVPSANLLAPPDGEVKDMASLQQTLRDWMAGNEVAVKKIGLIVGFGYIYRPLAFGAFNDRQVNLPAPIGKLYVLASLGHFPYPLMLLGSSI